ncbi:hypothetical protein BIFCAT_00995 [Bifidobacterium catenulatum DSM 16992 = JCM 1194 = LMG 11043]|uniref:Uncharacterized protein n=1 Tax=Bifidobacterium catenulatum DSM 16992 = JCM 1194 = LMG 11043 TaxID=566552 RepID=B6XTM5_9BIFI|nr:hypothetical protein BIFCAT_00995 [Bifidobacterium catenulatum DSM 16992 = JCM 1194 = LMG 11043]
MIRDKNHFPYKYHPPFCQIFQDADNKKATRLSQDSCVAKR